MKVGYSCWGFLGAGVLDTPDGGRSWRRTLLDALADQHRIMLLQANRDLDEAGEDLTGTYTWDQGLPPLDALFLEWRWPLPGRNTTDCGTPGHTCDLHRQQQLLDHYTLKQGIPTIIWDTDHTLAPDDPLRHHPAVTVCELAFHPRPGTHTLLCPVADHDLDQADPHQLAARTRDLDLVYVGNQYGRDDAFSRYFAPAAARHSHQVAGKWTSTAAWPHVNFTGRIAHPEGRRLHERALTTVLLLPPRYAAAGAVSQRLFESVLAGCLPLGPGDARSIEVFVPPPLIVEDGRHASDLITHLWSLTPERHAELLQSCLSRLDLFRASRQVATVNRLLAISPPPLC